MKANSGKVFEDQFKKSVPDYCLLQRLNDSPQAFSKSNLTRFTCKTPCDFFMFDNKAGLLYCLELKSTKNTSMTFDDILLEEEQDKMVHKHQILGLASFSKHDRVVAGFLFNFRDEKRQEERTYFQDIRSFVDMTMQIGKKSFNENDLRNGHAIQVNGVKQRVHYLWDIDGMLKLKH